MVEHHEHGHEGEGKNRDTLIAAITAAVLAVCAAIGSLLSGHAANDGIREQTSANDAWAYYQAKSVKGHLYEANHEILRALATLQPNRAEETQDKADAFRRKVAKYEEDKAETMKEAREHEAKSRHEFARHEGYSLGVASFQIGIVLASISILVRYRALYFLGLLAGLAGFGFLVYGLTLREPPPPKPPQGEARLAAPFGELHPVRAARG